MKKKKKKSKAGILAISWQPFGIAKCGFSHCEIRNVVFRIAKFAVKFRIAKFRIAKFAVKFRIAKFSHCEFSHCEIFALCEQFAKIPTVLPSDFVLRITFSSELRFRRFWYRWKS